MLWSFLFFIFQCEKILFYPQVSVSALWGPDRVRNEHQWPPLRLLSRTIIASGIDPQWPSLLSRTIIASCIEHQWLLSRTIIDSGKEHQWLLSRSILTQVLNPSGLPSCPGLLLPQV